MKKGSEKGNRGKTKGPVKAKANRQGAKKNGDYEVVWPCGESVGKVTPLSKRLDSLEGKTICELWDYVFQGDKIYGFLEEELSKKYPGIKFVNYRTFGSTHGGDERKTIAALPDLLKKHKCDAVLSSMGC